MPAAIATGDGKLATDLKALRQYGWYQHYISDLAGMNSRLDEIHAAMLTARLSWMGEFNQRRQAIAKAYREKGSTLLASYTYPLQFMWGRKKLESLDDIKGMKLRVAQPEQGEFVRRFGGTSITMSAPEVPSALDRGVVDGIFTAGVGAVLWKDLLKFGYVLIVNVNNSYFIVNTDAYRKLSPQLQDQLRKAAEDGARWDQDTMKTEEAESVQLLKSAGYTFTQAKPDEITRAVDTMRPYWGEWAKARGPEVVEALGKVRAALGR